MISPPTRNKAAKLLPGSMQFENFGARLHNGAEVLYSPTFGDFYCDYLLYHQLYHQLYPLDPVLFAK